MVRNFMMRKGAYSAYYREFFTSSGNWVCPPGVAKVNVLIISSGLKGATATSENANGGGAGGRGGFYYYLEDYPVIPGQAYPIVVGDACSSTSARNPSDFNGLVAGNDLSVFNSYNTTGGDGGKGGFQDNVGVGSVNSSSLRIAPIIRNTDGEQISLNKKVPLVDHICYGGSPGDWTRIVYGSSTQRYKGGNGFSISILDLNFNTNSGYGCGGKGGESYQRQYQSGSWAKELREGANGGQGLVVLLYYK